MKAHNVLCAPRCPSLACRLRRAGADSGSQPVTLTVMAAASLTDAFTEMGKQFEAEHPGVTVQFNFAGSQQLAQQIIEGAPADVFASANQKQMQAVVDAGKIAADAVTPFASNRLVVIYPKDNPAGLADLAGLAITGPQARSGRQRGAGGAVQPGFPG